MRQVISESRLLVAHRFSVGDYIVAGFTVLALLALPVLPLCCLCHACFKVRTLSTMESSISMCHRKDVAFAFRVLIASRFERLSASLIDSRKIDGQTEATRNIGLGCRSQPAGLEKITVRFQPLSTESISDCNAVRKDLPALAG
jgi:hypothetical protein